MMSAITSAGSPAFACGSAKGAVWAEAADAAASAASAPPQYSPFIISLSPNRRPHPLRPLFSLESLQLLAIDLDAEAWPFGQPERMIVIVGRRSEEHTSELQSLMSISYAVFCWKKKNYSTQTEIRTH